MNFNSLLWQNKLIERILEIYIIFVHVLLLHTVIASIRIFALDLRPIIALSYTISIIHIGIQARTRSSFNITSAIQIL